jgi:hypothetical protein
MQFAENITIVGGFNPSLIEPTWLKNAGIVKGDVNIQLDPKSRQMRYLLTESQMQLQVDAQRILAFPANPGVRITAQSLTFVKEIFKRLEHTPVDAIGFNASETAKDSLGKCLNTIHDQFASSVVECIRGVVSPKAHHLSFTQDWEGYQLTLILDREKARGRNMIKFNFHKQNEKNRSAKDVVSNFLGDIEKFRRFIMRVVG